MFDLKHLLDNIVCNFDVTVIAQELDLVGSVIRVFTSGLASSSPHRPGKGEYNRPTII